jgi:RNA-binding protein PNO1
MPAPTALRKEAVAAADIPLPDADPDEDLELDLSANPELPQDATVKPALAATEDTEMALDEEGRPRFEAVKHAVRITSLPSARGLLTKHGL